MRDKKIKIIIADDHAILRKGIKLLLEDVDKFDIVGEAADGEQALALCHKLKPQILVSDISMPSISGLELASTLRDECPNVKVLLLTMHQEAEYVIKAFKNGVFGYLHKGVQEGEIVTAIEEIAEGNKYYNHNVAKILAESLMTGDDKKERDAEKTNQKRKRNTV